MDHDLATDPNLWRSVVGSMYFTPLFFCFSEKGFAFLSIASIFTVCTYVVLIFPISYIYVNGLVLRPYSSQVLIELTLQNSQILIQKRVVPVINSTKLSDGTGMS